MSTYEEKIGILSQMIAFAQSDHSIKESEYDFIFNVAQTLGVTKKAFDELLGDAPEPVMPKKLGERIVQFHRLLLLMNIDQKQQLSELKKLHEMGFKLGLSPAAIEEVLSEMHKYPNFAIPPKKLIEIFRNHYN
ncbi:TerB family tellurite resistance protein [Croceivirga thetidis]|uniref:TerB family tellurite resistance protein n=1 Tax=Croceivirga thetidis TaxID=2721623 RepID=A0ABX1GSK6_9FLAO|nr:TerB family tellurite resistance protein [Croceivirga thetidis]NKI32933.1 TerB family tellurite resistance protein [Croceivirga thetidis]